MASSSHSLKRKKSHAIKRVGHLENVFLEISRKVINTPKLLSFNWLKEQNLKEVRKALKDQKLRKFLEMYGNTYPDLVKVFYTNLLVDGENMYSLMVKKEQSRQGTSSENVETGVTSPPSPPFRHVKWKKGLN